MSRDGHLVLVGSCFAGCYDYMRVLDRAHKMRSRCELKAPLKLSSDPRFSLMHPKSLFWEA